VKERKQTYTKYKTRQNNNYFLEIVIIIIIKRKGCHLGPSGERRLAVSSMTFMT
jgi:hypothetical protein